MPYSNPENKLLSVKKAAQFLSVSSDTIRRWAHTNQLKGIKVGSRGDWRFTKKDLLQMIQNLQENNIDKDIPTQNPQISSKPQPLQQIPNKTLDKWQNLISLLSKTTKIPLVILAQCQDENIQVLLSNQASIDYPNRFQDFLSIGSFCKQTIDNGKRTYITSQTTTSRISFLAYPIKKLDNSIFGILCVIDFKNSNFPKSHEELLVQFKDIIQDDLQTLIKPHLNKRIKNLESLIKDEHYFQNIADLMPQIVWTAKPNGEVDYYNKRWEEFTGIKTTDGHKWGWKPAVHPEDAKITAITWENSIKTEKVYEIEHRILRGDGTYRWLLSRGIPIKNEKGKIVKWYGTATDIHEQKSVEEQLRKTQEEKNETLAFLDSLLTNAPIGFAFFDTNHKFIKVNPFIAKINGFTAQEHIGQPVEKILPINGKKVASVLDKVVKTGKSVYEIETSEIIPTDPGKNHYWLVNFYPIFNENKKVKFIGSVVVDITERKKMEQQKDDFMGIVSHELKTPVTSLKAFCQILEKKFKNIGDEKSANLLSKMNGQLDKLTGLISDLLDVTKIESGKMEYKKETFSFDELVEEVVEEMQRTTNKQKIIIKGKTKTNIISDKEKIDQVITNFLSNAIKYAPDSNKIIVKSSVIQKDIKLEVQDFGIGIPKDKQALVFDRFYRVKGENYDNKPGTGLGLYVSSQIINHLGGKIGLKSIQNQGATFYFTLPINSPIKTINKNE
jgi:PAS domain S-box-containing protein/excisionase family DNA binding protein